MSKYSNKNSSELESLYQSGHSDNYKIEQELFRRGYDQDNDGYFSFEEEYGQGNGKEEESGLGALFLLIFGAVLVVASLIGSHFILGYSTNYTPHIWIAFGLSFLFMVLSRGRSKFLNFVFYLGCFALATRLFVTIIEMLENEVYVSYITHDSTTLTDMIKYGFYYGIYIAFVPYLTMKIITAITRAFREPSAEVGVEGRNQFPG
ncbi:hypothetical protein JOC95_001854 [Bacillus tianshenii]|uniref:Uncharacterized protein n=1 Tax=Sutcliffiella tianshenii TaxID=1463404 RepID=A0ABS2NZD1_9BACI|nr:hypothetical protein [Bacillus tianshenii]MBM7620002.1 hypothetical protein [Bacillus tianshenii]